MRGDDRNDVSVFSYISPEARILKDHPLRSIRQIADRYFDSVQMCKPSTHVNSEGVS